MEQSTCHNSRVCSAGWWGVVEGARGCLWGVFEPHCAKHSTLVQVIPVGVPQVSPVMHKKPAPQKGA